MQPAPTAGLASAGGVPNGGDVRTAEVAAAAGPAARSAATDASGGSRGPAAGRAAPNGSTASGTGAADEDGNAAADHPSSLGSCDRTKSSAASGKTSREQGKVAQAGSIQSFFRPTAKLRPAEG
jgi:hypothetical protein